MSNPTALYEATFTFQLNLRYFSDPHTNAVGVTTRFCATIPKSTVVFKPDADGRCSLTISGLTINQFRELDRKIGCRLEDKWQLVGDELYCSPDEIVAKCTQKEAEISAEIPLLQTYNQVTLCVYSMVSERMEYFSEEIAKEIMEGLRRLYLYSAKFDDLLLRRGLTHDITFFFSCFCEKWPEWNFPTLHSPTETYSHEDLLAMFEGLLAKLPKQE